jgi:molecular chaperone IbpA
MSRELSVRTLDIPTIHKFGIGFDAVFDELLRISNAQQSLNYPPHNVIKIDENYFIIQFAVAGFGEGEIDVQIQGQTLTVSGQKNDDKFGIPEYLVRGISMRDFQRSFQVADHVEVKKADMTNGILSIHLERILPVENMPKKIDINFNK